MEELSAGPGAAEDAKARLRTALTEAMRAKDALRTRVLRALVAAIDDAQAPPVGARRRRATTPSPASPAATSSTST